MKLLNLPTKANRNTTVDTLRLAAAFLVVLIHSGIHGLDGKIGALGTFALIFGRLAVPFFFVVSGYFLYSNNYKKQEAKTRKAIDKLLNIFILSSILYFIFFGWYFGSYAFTIGLITPESLYKMLALNHPIYNEALWFILALVGANIVIYLNAKFIKKDGLLLFVSSCLYLLGLLFSNYSQALGTSPIEVSYYRNFLGEGILFVLIGYMCAKYSERLSQIELNRLIKYSVIGLIFYIIEFYAIKSHVNAPADIYLSLPVISLLIMIWAIKYPSLLRNTPIPDLGASLALYIYILHILFLYSIDVLFSRIGIDGHNHYIAIARLLGAFALSLGVGYLYLKAKEALKTRVPEQYQFK